MFDGKIAGIVDSSEANVEEIGLLMTGSKLEGGEDE